MVTGSTKIPIDSIARTLNTESIPVIVQAIRPAPDSAPR